jgi:hypothetical protein
MAFFMKLEGLQPPQEFIEKQGYKKIQSYRLTEYQQPKKTQ